MPSVETVFPLICAHLRNLQQTGLGLVSFDFGFPISAIPRDYGDVGDYLALS